MSDMPLVSVAIPCYNHEKYVQECIQSVIDQDYKNIELIIIDDGSTDNSVENINELIPLCKQRFVRFKFLYRDNKGLSATLNEAIAWCKGVYFSAIASDDIMYSTKTSVLIPYLERDKDAAGVFCGCNLINSDGEVVGRTNSSTGSFLFDDVLLGKAHIYAPTQLLRIDCLKHVGGYISGIFIEDWYMWLALTNSGYHLLIIDGLLVGYRTHDSNSSKNAIKMYEERKNILGYFKSKKKYKEALSGVALMASIDYTSISKIDSSKYMIESVMHSRKILLTPIFYACILRILTPRFLVLSVKSALNTFQHRN